jgi:alpha-L-arabinofuranosidase
VRIVGADVLTGGDLTAANTVDAPSHVVPQKLDTPRAGAQMTFEIPARSYAVIRTAQR